MNKPRIEVLGVYKLRVSDDLIHNQYHLLYGDDMSDESKLESMTQIKDQLNSTVLIEVNVIDRDTNFNVSHFTQPVSDLPESSWQAPWSEVFLNPEGDSLVVDRWSRTPENGDLRIAFFMHYWNPSIPLRSGYGDFECPKIKDMPHRLSKLVPYVPLD